MENQRFSNTSAGVDGTYYLEQGIAINGKARYTADNVFFYGYNNLNDPDNPAISFDKEDVRQRFSTIDVGANVFNGERTVADFNYQAGFDFAHLQDSYAARENGFDRNQRHQMVSGTPLSGSTCAPISLLTATPPKESLHNFYLQPNFHLFGRCLPREVGLNLVRTTTNFPSFPTSNSLPE